MTNKYSELTQTEKEILTAKLSHAMSKSNVAMESVGEIMEFAEEAKLFDGVKFGHEEVYNQPERITTGH
jgi:hypothetical protein